MLEGQLDQELGDPIPCRLFALRRGRGRRFRRRAGVSGRRRVRVNTPAHLPCRRGASEARRRVHGRRRRSGPGGVFVHHQRSGQEPRQSTPRPTADSPMGAPNDGPKGSVDAYRREVAEPGPDPADAAVPTALWPEIRFRIRRESAPRRKGGGFAVESHGHAEAAGRLRKRASPQRVSCVAGAAGRPGTSVALLDRHDEPDMRRIPAADGPAARRPPALGAAGSRRSVRPLPPAPRARARPPHAARPVGPHALRRRGRGPPRPAVRARGVRAALRAQLDGARRRTAAATGSRCSSGTRRTTRGSATR